MSLLGIGPLLTIAGVVSAAILILLVMTHGCKLSLFEPSERSTIRYGLESTAAELPIEDLVIILEEAGSKMMSRPLSLIHVDSQSI